MKRIFGILPLISALFLIFASCSEEYFTTSGTTWGTTYHIAYSAAAPLDTVISAALRLTDNELSMFNPHSTVSRINRGETSEASPEFIEIFYLSQKISRISGGVYDPTVGPLSNLWGFGTDTVTAVPSDSAIVCALSAVGIGDCAIDSAGTVVKKSSATVFDFSSIAKGYGIDLVGRALEENGVTDYMIEIGGEVLARGHNPKGRPWRIQIDSPDGGMAHRRLAVVSLGPDRSAVASSGNYRNLRRRPDGTAYGHTLSPLSGHPAESTLAAATVMAADCATADALATACMASASPDSALAIVRRAGAEALIVAVTPADTLAVITTEGFRLE